MHKTNQGFCAEIFEAENNRLLKLYFPTWSKEDAAQEYAITKSVNELGIASPAVYDFVEQEGRYGFTMEKLQDDTMLHHIHKHLKEAFALAKDLARLHFEIHSHPADKNILPTQEQAYLQKIHTRETLSDEEKENLSAIIRQLTKCDDKRVCHGDFHPMNILYQGDKPVVIDWAFACAGDPRGDVAGTYLITKIMATTAAARSPFDQFMYNMFTPLFADLYLKEYLRLSGYSKKEIQKWIPVRAATYLDFDIPEKANKKLYKLAKKYGRKASRVRHPDGYLC